MKNNLRTRARSALDKRFDAMKPLDRFTSPPKGWVRAIRDAIGMSGGQLARRMGVTPQSIVDLERSEAAGSISLATLRKAAAAMDCVLIYALAPRTSLAKMVDDRAREIARRELGGVAHSMALEDQAASGDLDARIRDFIDETLRERDLWNER